MVCQYDPALCPQLLCINVGAGRKRRIVSIARTDSLKDRLRRRNSCGIAGSQIHKSALKCLIECGAIKNNVVHNANATRLTGVNSFPTQE